MVIIVTAQEVEDPLEAIAGLLPTCPHHPAQLHPPRTKKAGPLAVEKAASLARLLATANPPLLTVNLTAKPTESLRLQAWLDILLVSP